MRRAWVQEGPCLVISALAWSCSSPILLAGRKARQYDIGHLEQVHQTVPFSSSCADPILSLRMGPAHAPDWVGRASHLQNYAYSDCLMHFPGDNISYCLAFPACQPDRGWTGPSFSISHKAGSFLDPKLSLSQQIEFYQVFIVSISTYNLLTSVWYWSLRTSASDCPFFLMYRPHSKTGWLGFTCLI